MQHVFPHQNAYQPDWHHPHAQSQQHHYAQSQATAAANAAAQQQQQQHYGRMTQNGGSNGNNNGGMNTGIGAGGRDHDGHGAAMSMMNPDQQMSEENRKVLEWVTQVLNGNTREAALLELSKKREQVPELALILWHSFGGLHEGGLL